MTLAVPIEKRLEGEIARVLKIMEEVRDRPGGLSEADTKAALINPILSALGWEPGDPSSVSEEYRHKQQDNPVDYALFVLWTQPVLFVEAKALNKDLSDHRWITQTLAYASAAGVEWCVLTNGDEYRIYNTLAKAEAEKKIFREVRLSRDERAFCIETLLLLSKQQMVEAEKQINVLWKGHFVDRQVREAVSTIFREPDAALVRMIVKRTQDLQHDEVRESLRRANVTVEFPRTPVQAEEPASSAPSSRSQA